METHDVEKPNIDVKKRIDSVVSKHRLINNHDFNWSTPRNLHYKRNRAKREIAEMFFINTYINAIKLQKDTENLNSIYNGIIK